MAIVETAEAHDAVDNERHALGEPHVLELDPDYSPKLASTSKTAVRRTCVRSPTMRAR